MRFADRAMMIAAVLIGMTTLSAFAAPTVRVPIHATILAVGPDRRIVVRQAAVPLELPALTSTYRVANASGLRVGEEIDAVVHGTLLEDVTPAKLFTAGMPDTRIKSQVAIGDTLPPLRFLDQRGDVVQPGDWLGKTVVLSFIYSRCPDREICRAISGKYAYLQHHLDATRTKLIEITVDPNYDSPAVLAKYGAQFGNDPDQWALLTGEQNQIAYALGLFGLSNLETQPGNFVHDDTLAIIAADGRIAELIPTVGWSPDDVIASVEHAGGQESNPLRRLELGAIAGVVSLCGGSITTGVVMLDSVVFLGGVVVLGSIVFWFGRRIWSRNE